MRLSFSLLLLVAGCAGVGPRVLPEQLVLRLEPAGLLGDQPALAYELENNSAVPVCLGGSSELFMGDRSVESRVQLDALCDKPLKVIPPGESTTWRAGHASLSCDRDWPANLRAAFPERVCGAEVEVHAEVVVFRMVRHRPRFGGIRIQSSGRKVVLLQPRGGDAG